MGPFGKALIVAMFVCTSTPLLAQTTNTGVITGTVVDEQGLDLPGAVVELVNESTVSVRPLTTGANGAFTFSAVDPATYTLKVSMAGFRTVERRSIQLRSRETLKIDGLALQVGQFNEVTTVTADVAVVQTGTAANQTTLETDQ